MSRKQHSTSLPAPFLRRVTLKDPLTDLPGDYPFTLPWLSDSFELGFNAPVTIFMGENGIGKSTLIEALAALSGYDQAGGGKGYRPVDHAAARETNGGALGDALRGGWLPKITNGWFFRAESFFSVARYLDAVNRPSADFLSHSHGEGFLRLFSERMQRQGIYFLDEPESALSPKRQVDLLSLLADIQQTGVSQVIMATHSPMLMAVPGADLRRITPRGVDPVHYRDTDHFRLWQNFTTDPEEFVSCALAGDIDSLV